METGLHGDTDPATRIPDPDPDDRTHNSRKSVHTPIEHSRT
jgi:hypothetical protein